MTTDTAHRIAHRLVNNELECRRRLTTRSTRAEVAVARAKADEGAEFAIIALDLDPLTPFAVRAAVAEILDRAGQPPSFTDSSRPAWFASVRDAVVTWTNANGSTR